MRRTIESETVRTADVAQRVADKQLTPGWRIKGRRSENRRMGRCVVIYDLSCTGPNTDSWGPTARPGPPHPRCRTPHARKPLCAFIDSLSPPGSLGERRGLLISRQ